MRVSPGSVFVFGGGAVLAVLPALRPDLNIVLFYVGLALMVGAAAWAVRRWLLWLPSRWLIRRSTRNKKEGLVVAMPVEKDKDSGSVIGFSVGVNIGSGKPTGRFVAGYICPHCNAKVGGMSEVVGSDDPIKCPACRRVVEPGA